MALTQKQIDAAVQRDHHEHIRIAEAARRYEGDWPDPLRPFWCPSDRKGDDNYTLNLSKVAVDTAAHFLFGDGIDVEIDGVDDSPADQYLDAMWEQNGEDQWLIDLATVGGVSGHAFVRIHAPDESQGEQYPRLEILDPQNVTVIRDPLDYCRVLAYIITATAHNPHFNGFGADTLQHQQVIERNEAGTWTITSCVQEMGGARRVTAAPIQWPYSWCPIVAAKNLPSLNQFWGTPDLSRDVIRANHGLNFALSNTNRIVRLQGHSKTVVTGVDAEALMSQDSHGNPIPVLNWAPDDVTVLEAPDAKVHQIAPGIDIASHISYISELTTKFWDVAQIPEIALGKITLSGPVPGVSLKIAYTQLVNKTKTKRNLYGALLKAVCKAVLEMAGFGYEHQITLNWPAILPENETEKLQAALLKRQLGVAPSTILSELGYEAQEQMDKAAQELAAMPIAQPTSNIPAPAASQP